MEGEGVHEMVLGDVLPLVVENVIACNAAWYWAGVALPVKVRTPPA